MQEQPLKFLQVRITQLKTKLNGLLVTKKDLDKDISTTTRQLQNSEQELRKLQNESVEPIVSEHAIIRYLERVQKIDIEQIKKEILTDKIKALIDALRSGRFSEKNFIVQVKNRVVTTILNSEETIGNSDTNRLYVKYA